MSETFRREMPRIGKESEQEKLDARTNETTRLRGVLEDLRQSRPDLGPYIDRKLEEMRKLMIKAVSHSNSGERSEAIHSLDNWISDMSRLEDAWFSGGDAPRSQRIKSEQEVPVPANAIRHWEEIRARIVAGRPEQEISGEDRIALAKFDEKFNSSITTRWKIYNEEFLRAE